MESYFIGLDFGTSGCRAEVINQNLETFNSKINQEQKNKIISQMWSNYGKTFIEYIFLHKLLNTK